MRFATVTLCENDERGNATGHCSAAHFAEGASFDAMPVLELESRFGPDLLDEDDDDAPNPDPTCRRSGVTLVVGDLAVKVHALRAHVGNLHWNGYGMRTEDAQRLAVYLRAKHGFQLNGWSEGQPFLPEHLLTGAHSA